MYEWKSLGQTVTIPVGHHWSHHERCESEMCLGLHGPMYCKHPQCALINFMHEKIAQATALLDKEMFDDGPRLLRPLSEVSPVTEVRDTN